MSRFALGAAALRRNQPQGGTPQVATGADREVSGGMSEPEIDESERERRRELTLFLRSRRAALSPPPASEPLRRRRRTPGLRREEVAERAGMSHVWYSWLERGRPIQVSPAMLERVAQALELNDDETAHLFTLVKRRAPRAESIETLPSAVVDILERHGNPACVDFATDPWQSK